MADKYRLMEGFRMLHFFIATAVVIFLLLLKRSFIKYTLWAAGFALYFYVKSSSSVSVKDLFSSTGVSKISHGLIDEQTRTALSFYTNLSHDRGDFVDDLSSLTNSKADRSNVDPLQSAFNNLSVDKIKEMIRTVLGSLHLDKIKI